MRVSSENPEAKTIMNQYSVVIGWDIQVPAYYWDNEYYIKWIATCDQLPFDFIVLYPYHDLYIVV